MIEFHGDVVGQAGHPYTSALLACEVRIDQPRDDDPSNNRFRIVPGELPDPRLPVTGCIYRDRCAFAFDTCATTTPADHDVANKPGHRARCHLLVPR